MSTNEQREVIVVGGGPAGSCAAALIAEQGHDVLLLERSESFPFKIGESLMPAAYWSLERLGVLDRMKESPFTKKYSVQFFNQEGKGTAPFFFREIDPHESSQTWQVLRSEFDQMLLDNASEKGAEVRRGVSVKQVLFDGDRAVGVKVGPNGGPYEEIGARVVVDASGQSALISKRLKLRLYDRRLQNAALFSHFRGAYRDPGDHGGATLVLHTANQDSWFWYIPLQDDVVSVGVVGNIDYLVRDRSGTPQEVFDEEVALCPEIGRRIEGAEAIRPVQLLRDFTYRAKQFGGDGWVTIGDAFGFIDPIYSSGVFLALKSGEYAADAILEGLRNDDLSASQLGKYGQEYLDGMEAIRKLVYAFYDRDFSFAAFLKANPECRGAVINLLVGNVYRESVDELFEPLGEVCDLPDVHPRLVG